MEYLLVMSLSGSTMTCLFLLLRRLMKERLCAGMYYILAKAAVLYYLVPLPFLKSWYREAVPAAVWENRREAERITLTWTRHTVLADGDLHGNIYVWIQAVVVIVWIMGVCFLLARQMSEYLRVVRRISGYAQMHMTDRAEAFVSGMKKVYGVRRRVSLLQAPDGEPTFTFGVYRPVIICGKRLGTSEAEMIVRHEMVHIMRLDVLWKFLMELARLLHWWNPFMWALHRDFEHISECACDETAMFGTTEAEKKAYLIMLGEEGQEKESDEMPMKWKSNFGGHRNYMIERMDNLMSKKHINRVAAGVLAATLIFANTVTVFAYRDGFSETLPENVTEEEVAFKLDNDFSVFTPDGMKEDELSDYVIEEVIDILYESQFTDEAGNVYPVWEDDGVEPHCNHVYISGKQQDHHPYSDGSCEVRIYKAQRCSKCGHVICGDWISTTTYAVCPH